MLTASLVYQKICKVRDRDGHKTQLRITSLCRFLPQEQTIKLKSRDDLPPLRNPDILVGENDLTSLSYLHEPAGEQFMHSSCVCSMLQEVNCQKFCFPPL